MAKTDGYVCQTGNTDWLRSNASGQPGSVGSVEDSASVRILRFDSGAVAGTKVDIDGTVSEGPTIDFSSVNTLLSTAAADEGAKRPYIVWAGVSPLSLREALVVWNTDIVLLNKSGISGAEAVATVGRLMVLKLEEPIAINGDEQLVIAIEPGVVGFYNDVDQLTQTGTEVDGEDSTDGGETPDPEDEEEPDPTAVQREACGTPVAQTAKAISEGFQFLEDLDDADAENLCSCLTVDYGDTGDNEDPEDGEGEDQDDALLFCDMCSVDAQCSDYEGDKSGFVVNNNLVFPVRCTTPFVLVNTTTCGCNGECEKPAEIWQVCMQLYGGTGPTQLFPLDALQEIDPCNIDSQFPGTILSLQGASDDPTVGDFPPTSKDDCGGGSCPSMVIIIEAQFGPFVHKTAEWTIVGDKVPYDGMPVIYDHCGGGCDPCSPGVAIYDDIECYVTEGIIKPVERTAPVQTFAETYFTTDEAVIQLATSQFETVIDECQTHPDGVYAFTFEPTSQAFVTAASVINSVDTDAAFPIPSAPVSVSIPNCPPSGGQWVANASLIELVVCVDGATSTVTVVGGPSVSLTGASCSSQDVVTTTGTTTVVTDVSYSAANTEDGYKSEAVEKIQPVTQCDEDVRDFWKPDEEQEQTIKFIREREDDDGDPEYTFIEPTTNDCREDRYHFLEHDLEKVSGQGHITIEANCCDGTAPQAFPANVRLEQDDCSDFFLLRAIYSEKQPEANARQCPCYDASAESECETDNMVEAAPEGDSWYPCTVAVRRLRRDWCACG